MNATAAARSASLIADMAPEERPRERLLRNGAKVLSDAELLAVLLRGGRRGASVLEVARELLAATGGVAGLSTASLRTLRCGGVGRVKTATVLAAVELACRIARAAVPERYAVRRPEAVVRYLGLRYALRDQEVLGALYVNARHELMAECELYRGTLHRAAVEPRAILREALVGGAAGVVLWYTHRAAIRGRAGRISPSLGGWSGRPRSWA